MISEFRKRLGGTALVLWDENLEECKDYRIEILKNNRLEGIPALATGSEDGSFKLFYDITGKQPLSVVFSKKKMDRKNVSALIRGVEKVLETVQEYLLEPEGLIFDPEYIFFTGEDKVDFLYLPDRQEDVAGALHSLGEYLISRVDHGDFQAVKMAYGFFEATGKDELVLEEIKRLTAVSSVGVGFREGPGAQGGFPDNESLSEENREAIRSVAGPGRYPDIGSEKIEADNYESGSFRGDIRRKAPERFPDGDRDHAGERSADTDTGMKDFDGPRRRDLKKGEKDRNKAKRRSKKNEDEVGDIKIKKKPGQKSVVDYLIWIAAAGVIIWLIYDSLLRRMGTKGVIAAGLLGVLAVDIIVTCIVKSRRKAKQAAEALGIAKDKKDNKDGRKKMDRLRGPDKEDGPLRGRSSSEKDIGTGRNVQNVCRGSSRRNQEPDSASGRSVQSAYREVCNPREDYTERDRHYGPQTDNDYLKGVQGNYHGTGLLREDPGKTGLLREEYEKTGLLSESLHQMPGLIPALGSTKNPLMINTFPFVVGKTLSYADGVIDDAYISRVHCRFTKADGAFYLTDLNSTNGTSLNGIPLDPNREYALQEGDELKLGRSTYIFSMVEC